MFFGYDPTNVIYNIYSPNENECINEPNDSMPDVFEDVSFQTYISNRGWGMNQNRFGNKHQFGWARKTNSFPLFGDTNRDVMRTNSYQNAFQGNYTPHFNQQSVNWVANDEVTQKVKKYCGPNLYCKDLKRVGQLLEKKIHIHFPTSVRKSLMLGWYAYNWDKIEPIIDEVTNNQDQNPVL